MLQPITNLSQLNEVYKYVGITVVLILLYIAYISIFKGSYDQRLKNIGRPLPAYPNGWYIVLHSKDLQNGKAESVEIAGQNLVVFRSVKGQAYALEAYCKHIGANLGIGGKVVNKKCIQCPFHGWMYDGQSGLCVGKCIQNIDNDGKPMKGISLQYNEDFCEKGKKLKWLKKQDQEIKLRKYPLCQMNGYIYVWIHSLPQHQQTPQYPMIDVTPITKDLDFRARTIHDIKCHIQDIPENGADIFHFKYVHSQVIPYINSISFLWQAKWKRGDDPNIKQMFEHPQKYARDFKQQIYKLLIQPFPKKQFLSIGSLDNNLKLPFLGYIFFFNVTIVQIGCSTVFIFLKSPLFTTVLFHFLQPKQRYRQIVYHEGYTSKWLPYWGSALAIRMQGNQVTNDMRIWDAKRFGRNIFFKKGEVADEFLQGWREWYSQHYEGCSEKQKNKQKLSW